MTSISPEDSRKSFQEAHKVSDVDFDRSSMHHTLGDSPNQAAPGDHTHYRVGDILVTVRSAPVGYLLCNGASYPTSDYPVLSQLRGGAATFTVPNWSPASGVYAYIRAN